MTIICSIRQRNASIRRTDCRILATKNKSSAPPLSIDPTAVFSHNGRPYPFSIDVQVKLLPAKLGDGRWAVTGGIQNMIGRLAIEGRALR